MKKTRILIADDHSVVRHGLVTLLKYEKDFDVVGEAADGATAVALAKETTPDVAVLDLRMPALDGVAATRAIRRETPATRGLSNAEIGTIYGISKDMVKAHMKVILKKLGAANRTEAVTLAMRENIL